MRPAVLAVLLAAIGAAEVSARTAAARSWSPPVTVSQPTPRTFTSHPSLAATAAGRGLVSWDYSAGLFGHVGQRVAERRTDGSFGPERELASWIEPPFAYGRNRAVALVQERTQGTRRVRVVFGSTSGRFGAERTIYTAASDAQFTLTRMAVNARGDIAVARLTVRRDRSRQIVLIDRPAGGRFGRATVIDEHREAMHGYVDGGVALSIAVGARGDLVVAWQDSTSIHARVRPAGQRMGPVVRIGEGYVLGSLRSAISSRGAIWVAWHMHPRGIEGRGPLTVRVATRAAGARSFGSAHTLEHLRAADFSATAPAHLVLDPRGKGFVAWSSPGPSGLARVRLARLDARGRVLSVRALSAPDAISLVQRLAASRRPGEVLVVWSRISGEERSGSVVTAALVGPGDALGPAQAVSDSERTGAPAAAFDPRTANPIVVWPETIGPEGPDVPAGKLQTVLKASEGTVSASGQRER